MRVSGKVRIARDLFNRYRRYVQNSSWIIVERGIYILLALVSSSVLARLLGPERFGVLSFSVALAAIFGAISHLGLAGLVVRELVRRKNKTQEVIATVFVLKAGAAIIAILLIAAYAHFFEESEIAATTMVVALSIAFRPWDTFDFWFQSRLQSKYSSQAKMLGKIVLVAWQVAAAALGAPLPIIATGVVISAAVTAGCMHYFYRQHREVVIKIRHVKAAVGKGLLKSGALVFIGTLLASLNIKADQFMLRWLSTLDEVGIYSAAVVLSEALYFLPAAVVASAFPRLIALKESDHALYIARLQQLLLLLAILGTGFAVCATIVAGPLTRLMFGPSFEGAALILSIHAWASIFIFVRAAVSRWILIEDMLVFSVLTHGLGAAINIALNLLLIPRFGAIGAAVGTVISYAIASHFALVLHRRGWPMFSIVSRALLWPFNLRYLREIHKSSGL